MAALYKLRLTEGMFRKCVWGIFYDECRCQVFHIDDEGRLSRGAMSLTDPRTYREHQVYPVYRAMHHILLRCYMA